MKVFLFFITVFYVIHAQASSKQTSDNNQNNELELYSCKLDDFKNKQTGKYLIELGEVDNERLMIADNLDITSDSKGSLVTKAGSKFIFVVPNDVAVVEIEEKKRKTQIASDFKKVVMKVLELNGSLNLLENNSKYQCINYTQKYNRSEISIKVTKSKKDEIVSHLYDEIVSTQFENMVSGRDLLKNNQLSSQKGINLSKLKSASDNALKKANKDEEETKRLLLGPSEHWYLAVDLPVSRTNELQFNQDTNQVEVKEVPANAYLSLNRSFSDILLDRKVAVSAKFLAKIAKRPSESYGIGLGFKLKYFDIFYARIKTQTDETEIDTDRDAVYSNVVGVSVNITEALKLFE